MAETLLDPDEPYPVTLDNEAGRSVFAYTGDTGPCDAAVDLARDADVLLAEATYQDASDIMPFHLSATQAGELAKAANAKHLILTHLTPGLDPEVSRREAAVAFDGTLEVAAEGMHVEIGL